MSRDEVGERATARARARGGARQGRRPDELVVGHRATAQDAEGAREAARGAAALRRGAAVDELVATGAATSGKGKLVVARRRSDANVLRDLAASLPGQARPSRRDPRHGGRRQREPRRGDDEEPRRRRAGDPSRRRPSTSAAAPEASPISRWPAAASPKGWTRHSRLRAREAETAAGLMPRVLGVDIGTRARRAGASPTGRACSRSRSKSSRPRAVAVAAMADRVRGARSGGDRCRDPVAGWTERTGPEAEERGSRSRARSRRQRRCPVDAMGRAAVDQGGRARRCAPAGANARKQRGVVDKVAAALVLQAYLGPDAAGR